ncbi:c-type cytochrome [Nocardioides marmotae]|uniref:Cytochrome bc1 complex cytochrome c subunit n=1 Tax=Nocardioides marmotae TaxID=2663857 RepID=A0A6I3JBK3_9ACTN|nr:cytochrome c [Nocardioides marmotae]MCR6031884.1 c-type cytochrome [Gordonia jinghuaiqii]MTB83293.1 c-type cytochrome [Nocardioides marmotae]MTB95524.1 c-type cytochrome [Nocardioides marmotae]
MRLLNRSAGRLSRHRRGPLAGVVLMLLGLVLTGSLYAAFAPAQATSAESDAEQVAKGRELFLVGCAFCHGQNGEGILTQRGDTQLGPPLVGVGAAAVDFQVGTGRMPMSQPGQQAPDKEVVYSQDEIDALGAYVASLGPGPAVPSPEDYSLEGLTEEEREEAIVRGGQIFLTNCTACHNFNGSGGAMPRGGSAPSLHDVEPKYIYEALLTGPQQMPNFSNGNLPPEEKRDVIAYLESLRETPEYGGFGLGGLGPVSEGLFAWLVGIGGLVGFAIWIAAHTTRSTKKKGQAA